ncbi:M50 family peptidase [Corallincola luteus]|uniref:M50 family peptidase n=1 Tax=Corallincola luteus TaxID=1775177 RepID=A0ABY2AG50_9GAMM|nr:M50 family metallopeptidase [Corallincola luteus]TCI01491.1 M50 family peptidase [Corallincola luteus]
MLKPRIELIVALLCALILIWLPLVSAPLKYFETLLHEGSHGLAAILSGGQVVSIALHLDGSGLATSRGGWSWLVTFSGYAGASLWAYTLARIQFSSVSRRVGSWIYFAIVGLFVLGSLIYTRDPITLLIVGFIGVTYWCLFRWRHQHWATFANQVLALFILLQSAISPSYLLYVGDRGDHLAMKGYTGIPGIVWVVLWTLIAGLMIFDLCRRAWAQPRMASEPLRVEPSGL